MLANEIECPQCKKPLPTFEGKVCYFEDGVLCAYKTSWFCEPCNINIVSDDE